VSIASVIRALQEEYEPLAAAKGLSLRVRVRDATLRTDEVRLKRMIGNVLSNAIKYSSNRPEQLIEISAEDKHHEVVYSIRDNGVGFDMRFYNKLFGVFQRLHTEKEFPGTGVGLAIAQRVIVRHGGRIWAESKLDEYTIFNFSLPKEGTS